MEIDFSAYLGVFPFWENKYADASGDGMIRLMNRDGIKRAVVLSLRAVYDDIEAGNTEMFKAVERYPDRLIPAVTISPYMGRHYKRLMRDYRMAGARVLKLFPFYHSYSLSPTRDEDINEMMTLARELGYVVCIPIRLFMNFYFIPVNIADLCTFVTKYNEIPIVIDCFNYSEFTTIVEIAEQNPHIYIGTSALTMYNGIEMLSARLGAERLLGGTCAPLQIPACGIKKVTEALLKDSDKDKILGGNAKVLLETTN
jgi:predicted TIM-barrel fold metal-dependent hydrolase